jgi:hypothetical protein
MPKHVPRGFVDAHYRDLMLVAMAIELLLLSFLVGIELVKK